MMPPCRCCTDFLWLSTSSVPLAIAAVLRWVLWDQAARLPKLTAMTRQPAITRPRQETG